MRKLLISSDTRVIINRIEVAPDNLWTPPAGYVLEEDREGADIGDRLEVDGTLVKKLSPAPEPEPDWKQEWLRAATIDQKLIVLARKLGVADR